MHEYTLRVFRRLKCSSSSFLFFCILRCIELHESRIMNRPKPSAQHSKIKTISFYQAKQNKTKTPTICSLHLSLYPWWALVSVIVCNVDKRPVIVRAMWTKAQHATIFSSLLFFKQQEKSRSINRNWKTEILAYSLS